MVLEPRCGHLVPVAISSVLVSPPSQVWNASRGSARTREAKLCICVQKHARALHSGLFRNSMERSSLGLGQERRIV